MSAKPTSTIRFTGHPSGTLDTDAGCTALAYLPAIFALSRTRGPLNGQGVNLFQTDAAGLKRLEDMAEQAGDYISDIIKVIGELMSVCEPEELERHTLIQVGFLLRGLCELREEVAGVRSDAAYQASQRGGNAKAKP